MYQGQHEESVQIKKGGGRVKNGEVLKNLGSSVQRGNEMGKNESVTIPIEKKCWHPNQLYDAEKRCVLLPGQHAPERAAGAEKTWSRKRRS